MLRFESNRGLHLGSTNKVTTHRRELVSSAVRGGGVVRALSSIGRAPADQHADGWWFESTRARSTTTVPSRHRVRLAPGLSREWQQTRELQWAARAPKAAIRHNLRTSEWSSPVARRPHKPKDGRSNRPSDLSAVHVTQNGNRTVSDPSRAGVALRRGGNGKQRRTQMPPIGSQPVGASAYLGCAHYG